MNNQAPKDYPALRVDENAASDLEKILETLMALPENPYIAGAIVVVKGFGIISELLFQNKVLSDLNDIKIELDEINKKVDQILSILSNLDSIMGRVLKDHEKTAITNYFWSVRSVLFTIMANYVKGGSKARKKISDDDTLRLMNDAHEVSKKMFELSRWGYDAHLGVAYGYSTYLLITRAIGKSYADPTAMRKAVYENIVEARDGLTEQRKNMSNKNSSLLASLQELDVIHRNLILEIHYPIFWVSTLEGNWRDGFNFDYSRDHSYEAPHGYIWYDEASPRLAVVPRALGKTFIPDMVEGVLNEASAALRNQMWPDQDLKNMDALIASASAIAEAILVA